MAVLYRAQGRYDEAQPLYEDALAIWKRVFKPAWRDRPLGVLSNNDGCIVARSNELKAAGIPMGAPYFQIKGKLEAMNAVIVSSNYALSQRHLGYRLT